MTRLRLLAWLCVLAVLVIGCGHGDELAKLYSKQGTVDHDLAASQGKWSTADVGVAFKVNDGVRTGTTSGAKLKLSDGSGVALQEKTLLRFLATPPGKKKGQGLDVQTGEVVIDVAGEGMDLFTPFGPATLDAGSRVKLHRTDQGARFEVEIGVAHLGDAHKDVKAGESIEVGIGSAVIDNGPPPAPSASVAPAPSDAAAPPADSAAALDPAPPGSAAPADSAAGLESRKPGPDFVDLMVAPGDSMVIHDPRPPTAIGFASKGCAGLTVLDLGGKKRETVGSGRASALFAGRQHYRLRCDGDAKPFAEGTITVVADGGTRRLAISAPSNLIDTDGRRYTILYQSLLPKVSVRWPNPPSGSSFTLNLSGDGKQKTFSSSTPSYSLPAGAVAEGNYELFFQGGGERSRTTTMVVQFDNAAPTASISSPAERGFAPGATVSVSGMALPGWSVSAGGHELAQDSQWRFSGEVGAPSDVGALLIRFSHPQRGVHYYLRRSSR